MARLMYRENNKWKSVERIEKVASGSLVGMPNLDPEEVQEKVESATAKDTSESIDSNSSDVSPDDWKLKQTPNKYLANSPKGPQAELAKKLVNAGLGDITVDDMEEEEEEEES